MKLADVKVGCEYRARVSGRLVTLRIDHDLGHYVPLPGQMNKKRRHRGFEARNLATNRTIQVSAARLRPIPVPAPSKRCGTCANCQKVAEHRRAAQTAMSMLQNLGEKTTDKMELIRQEFRAQTATLPCTKEVSDVAL